MSLSVVRWSGKISFPDYRADFQTPLKRIYGSGRHKNGAEHVFTRPKDRKRIAVFAGTLYASGKQCAKMGGRRRS
jgi:hypothetical protein